MQKNILELEQKSRWVRRQVLEMISSAGKGHIGGAFSCADILVALYYGGILRFDSTNKESPGRDRFILSKGHSAASLYAVLADLGYFALSELENYQKETSILRGHPDRKIPGIEADTGSLGHGLGIGAGIALGAKMDAKDFITCVLLGDGECCEGSVWEAAMFAGHHKLNNLVAIVDRNGICVTDFLKDCLDLEPLDKKWVSCGWDVVVIDGHSHQELLSVCKQFHNKLGKRPLVVIANTVKGKGVSFMEGNLDWHHSVPRGEDLERAKKELEL
ncbi:MAG: transketolase [Candidatus Saelkia tenebricola]|nr:transketolase [Candidatus Saelkia tenebricola]